MLLLPAKFVSQHVTTGPGWHNASYTSTTEFLRVDLGSTLSVSHVAYEPRVMCYELFCRHSFDRFAITASRSSWPNWHLILWPNSRAPVIGLRRGGAFVGFVWRRIVFPALAS
jgi:hypothetical protein